jgi:hypothetical protein
MDGLKLIERCEKELANEIQIVKTISNDIKMKFGLERCTKICLASGKVHKNNKLETQWRFKLKNLIQ